MPFVRYKVGDRGRLCTDKNCSCGSQEPILELEMARDNDLIQKADGSVAHYDCLFGVIERINLMLEYYNFKLFRQIMKNLMFIWW